MRVSFKCVCLAFELVWAHKICGMISPPEIQGAPTSNQARVVKLVDTGDLKSPDYCSRAGSIPASGTSKNSVISK